MGSGRKWGRKSGLGMPRKYNGKGDPRCLGDLGLEPGQRVPGETLARIGERFRARMERGWRKTGPRGKMQVRCYWYQQSPEGLLVPVRQITTARVVDEVDWVNQAEPDSKWIKGWVVWGREYVEVRKEIGDRYWKTMRLVGEGEWDGKAATKSRSLDWGRVIEWPRGGPGAEADPGTGGQIPGSDEARE